MNQTKEQITKLNCKIHIKIYKLKLLGLTNEEIALELKICVEHVYNVLKNYEAKPNLKRMHRF